MLRPGALLLDMDGLMVDSEPLWFEVEKDFARARGGDWTEALAHACIGRGLAHTFGAMHAAFGFEVDLTRDTAEIVEAFIARVAGLELKRGCAELLAAGASAGLPMALASSSHRRLIDAVVARFGIAARFGAVVSGDVIAKPKPAPDIFLKAAAELGVAPAECVVLEDSLAGVRAGRAAKMRTIAVPEGERATFEGEADFVVADLFEAAKLLAL